MNKKFKVLLITPVGTFHDSSIFRLYDQIKARDDASGVHQNLGDFVKIMESIMTTSIPSH